MTTATAPLGPDFPPQPATEEPDMTQLELFPESAVTGTGRPNPWPLPEIRVTAEAEAPAVDQLAFGDDEGGAL